MPEVFLERFPVSVTQKRHDRPYVSIVTRAGHIRDMTDTRNCARKTSGTQGSLRVDSLRNSQEHGVLRVGADNSYNGKLIEQVKLSALHQKQL